MLGQGDLGLTDTRRFVSDSAGFIVPPMFVYNRALLLEGQGFTSWEQVDCPLGCVKARETKNATCS
ncbi:MAG TPA: hypothetical protein DDZ84_05670 [Firmicutes bacterium]|nr:hypothetical protein [Bacillota bacterium]